MDYDNMKVLALELVEAEARLQAIKDQIYVELGVTPRNPLVSVNWSEVKSLGRSRDRRRERVSD